MSYESAELTKITINLCLVSTISVANTLSEICEKVELTGMKLFQHCRWIEE